MLKKIPTSDVTLGMYLQSLDGPWLSHPFWKTKFVLHDPQDLAALQRSSVPTVWIDISKGCDVEGAAAAPLITAPEPLPAPPIPSTPATPPVAASVNGTLEGEIERAAQALNRSKQAVVAMFSEARLGQAVNTERCLPVVEDVASSLARNPSAFVSLARLKTRDDYTYMHSVAVCALMIGLARQLGLPDRQVREAGMAGLLHDIGKMQMPLEVLNKPGQLTDAEFTVMRTHPERGHELLRDGAQVPAVALDVCLHHHEKMDGSGYPHKLVGDQISLMARMGAICDVYDAITSIRPYRTPWDPAGSLQRMSQWTGHFDPAVFQAFVKSVGIYPTGTLVRMQSGRLAVVVDQNPDALVKPRVRVFYSTKSGMPIPVQLLDLSAATEKDAIVGREPIENWGFTHLEELWNPLARH
ncbi:HD-GYP domain-containing protein [Roseateles sp. DC23W]|uniref:HD-GYP domain-containing protein n=1 Tax=Pelomonas dachongensis TaxID=3299029 RepID=A0ABW7EL29_9BURK